MDACVPDESMFYRTSFALYLTVSPTKGQFGGQGRLPSLTLVVPLASAPANQELPFIRAYFFPTYTPIVYYFTMAYRPSNNNNQTPFPPASSFPQPIMDPQQRTFYENNLRADWGNTFGGSSPRPAFYAVPTPPSPQWNQVPAAPSVAGPSFSTMPAPPPNPPAPTPSRARSRQTQPGQTIFQAVISPGPSASSSNSWQPPAPPMQGRFSLNPPPTTACRCEFQSNVPSRMTRHWEHSCPYNPNLTTYECEVCGEIISRKDNLKRHMKKHLS